MAETIAPLGCEADRIILNALETHGSQVIFDSVNRIVMACPVSSMCEGTADHEPECWIGQAMRYMPTSDCERALATAPVVTEEPTK